VDPKQRHLRGGVDDIGIVGVERQGQAIHAHARIAFGNLVDAARQAQRDPLQAAELYRRRIGEAREPFVDQRGDVAGAAGGDEGPAELQRQRGRGRAAGHRPLERRGQQIGGRPGVAIDHGAADGDQALVVGGVAGVTAGQ
jgi:hypothetical protein